MGSRSAADRFPRDGSSGERPGAPQGVRGSGGGRRDQLRDRCRARCTRCSVRTAPASRRPSRSSRAIAPARRATSPCSASIPAGRRGDFRDRIGIVLQTSGVEHELTRPRGADDLRLRPTASGGRSRRRSSWSASRRSSTSASGTLSGGQRRRLDLALGIVGRPALLFLDEPTTGFDPAARRQAWELVRDLCSGGTTVLLTTHYLDEAEHLADRVGVLAAGRLVAEGTPEELAAARARRRALRPARRARRPPTSPTCVPAGAPSAADRVEFTTTTPTSAVHAVTGWALERGIELTGLVVTRPVAGGRVPADRRAAPMPA